nr:hypothetical protein [Candidatus Sigynarchaeota archaeon]
MFAAVIDFIPVLLMFLGAMACLVVDLKRTGGRLFVVSIPVLAGAIELLRVMTSATLPVQGNLVANARTSFGIIACCTYAVLILVNGARDFRDPNVNRFYHVLGFLVMGGILGFIYADNLFLIGAFAIITQIFLAILKFIFPSPDKKAYNMLIAVYATGYIGFSIGCLIVNEASAGTGMALSTLVPVSTPALGAFFLVTGMLIMIATFPVSLVVHITLHMRSHASVKLYNVVFSVMACWKMLSLLNALELMGMIVPWILFVLGMASLISAITLIVKEMRTDKEKRIDIFVASSVITDFGIIMLLFSAATEFMNIQLDCLCVFDFTYDASIIMQLLVILASKSLFIVAIKNIKMVFNTDDVTKMGGLKWKQPVALLGFSLGSMAPVFPGLIVLDGVYRVIIQIPNALLLGNITFWILLAMVLATPMWVAIVGSWIFGGKDLPVSIRNAPLPRSRVETATLATMIAFAIAIVIVAIFMPGNSIAGIFLPN